MDVPPRLAHPQHSGSESHAGPGLPLSGNIYVPYEEPSPPDTIGSSNYTTDQFEVPPAKRQRLSGPSGAGTGLDTHPRTALPSLPDAEFMADTSGKGSRVAKGQNAAPAAAKKAQRKRSGCLTCRDRHISCDEDFAPECGNCRKSSRACIRGTRLNFHQIEVQAPPYLLPRSPGWTVSFKDESQAIASEYIGGWERYVPYDQPEVTPPAPSRAVQAPAQHHLHRQVPDVQENLPALSNANRDFGRQLQAQALYFSADRRPMQLEQMGYDHSYGQPPEPMPRGPGETYLPGTQMISSHMLQGAGFGSNYSISLDERLQPRADSLRPSHSYQSSDVSSVTSSLVPIGAGHGSQQTFNLQPLPLQQDQEHQPQHQQQYQPGTQEGSTNTPPSDKTTGERHYLSDEEEIYYMQVFISEVAIWMDSFDHQKHFSRVVPFLALKSPMLLNALLACGVKHLMLTDKPYDADKVLIYYDTATTQLLRSMQNPDRNMAECAATAAVLNVYEIMSESPQARMSHIAGARALIRECGWDARSTGIGGACFWLNIGMEVLSCLAFNWKTAWDPDQWGLDVSFITGGDDDDDGDNRGRGEQGQGGGDTSPVQRTAAAGPSEEETRMRHHVGGGGEDEAWVHRIFYIVARIANFRANIPRFQEASPHDEQARLQSRFAEWKRLKAMSDRWNDGCPRPLRPYGYANGRSKTSLFPNIWLIRRAAVVGRLFYHTAMCLLAQINPLDPRDSEENRAAATHHARQVCGIVAHTRDHGVASVSIRSVAIASSVLTDPAEQAEVLAILDRVRADTGWKLGAVLAELKKAWGWREPGTEGDGGGTTGLAPLSGQQPPPKGGQGGGGGEKGAAAGMMTMQPRPVHPLLARADFKFEDRPYRTWYKPPNGPNAATMQGLWCP